MKHLFITVLLVSFILVAFNAFANNHICEYGIKWMAADGKTWSCLSKPKSVKKYEEKHGEKPTPPRARDESKRGEAQEM